MGLEGEVPELVDPAIADPTMDRVEATQSLRLLGKHTVAFHLDQDVVLHRSKRPAFHSNAMTFEATSHHGRSPATRTYYSVGGGFVVDDTSTDGPQIVRDSTQVRYPFTTGANQAFRARAPGGTPMCALCDSAWAS
ncbi:serine dehydratase beta chain [Streptomyces sp. NPDC020192]|uniref:serine dehydratase beta chain n=1 Tax=Streptomyces sp. NPDC020192 TaxID=3365066 RepID=UPI0037A9B7EF